MNGREFLRLVKGDPFYAVYKHIPVVVLTTAIDDRDICYELGATIYSQKPDSVRVLRSLLTTLLSFDIIQEQTRVRDLLEYSGKGSPRTLI